MLLESEESTCNPRHEAYLEVLESKCVGSGPHWSSRGVQAVWYREAVKSECRRTGACHDGGIKCLLVRGLSTSS